jgi:citrate synthase
MAKDTLSITDNRTGKTYELKVEDGCIRTMDLRQIKTGPNDFGLMGYDPAFLNTANWKQDHLHRWGERDPRVSRLSH